ncbi:hypothetical protein PCLA_21f0042 [Pseudomonas citronellolis]|nr:hypothetical protein PCLA_21f0042 [Pseudomonas citronellolis]
MPCLNPSNAGFTCRSAPWARIAGRARSYRCGRNTCVGWVERSDTHRHGPMGFRRGGAQ